MVFDNRISQLLEKGDLEKAVSLIADSIDSQAIDEKNYEYFVNYAQILLHGEKLELALTLAQRLIEFNDQDSRLPEIIFFVLFKNRQYQDAKQSLDALHTFDPKSDRYHCWRLILSNVMSEHQTAIEIWETFFKEKPNRLPERIDECFYAIITAYIAFNRLTDADKVVNKFKKILAWDELNTLMVMAYYHRISGRFDESIEAYNRAERLYPDCLEVIWNRSLTRLVFGDVVKGWEDYEIRWKWADFPSAKRLFDQYVGTPDDCFFGKKVLVWGEQGIGDEIMFLSCLPYFLKIARCEKIDLEVNRKLVPIYQALYPEIQVREHGEIDCRGLPFYQGYDFVIPAGSLPRFLGEKIFDQTSKYHRFLTFSKTEKRELLGKFYDSYPIRVGLSWRSHHLASNRTPFYLGFGAVESILRDIPKHIGVVICQYALTDEEKQKLSSYDNVFVPSEDLFEDVYVNAKYVSCCDFQLAAGTNVNYLGGLTGVPTVAWGPWDAWSRLGKNYLPWYPNMSALFCDSGWDNGTLVHELKKGLLAVIRQLESQHRKAV